MTASRDEELLGLAPVLETVGRLGVRRVVSTTTQVIREVYRSVCGGTFVAFLCAATALSELRAYGA